MVVTKFVEVEFVVVRFVIEPLLAVNLVAEVVANVEVPTTVRVPFAKRLPFGSA